jgi:hypothetical protein
MAVEPHVGKRPLPCLQGPDLCLRWQSGSGRQRLFAIEMPKSHESAHGRVEAATAQAVQLDCPGQERCEVRADGGWLAVREEVIDPRQFARAEGVPVSFGGAEQSLDIGSSRAGLVQVRMEDLDMNAGAKGQKVVFSDGGAITGGQASQCQ